MKTKELAVCDVNKIVKIHQNTFKGFFLTELGEDFLKLYYSSCIKNKVETIALGIYSNENTLLGFAIGNVQSQGFYKRILKSNFLKFFMMGLYLIFTKPMALIRLMKNMDKVKKVYDDGLYSELLSIGISAEQNGKGYGKMLLLAFEKEVINRGIKKLSLTTDYENNDRAVGFYRNSGYEVFYEFTTYPNRKMYKFIKTV
jgi:ribosomal protein S18 acetylase RimI-like enzyme